jgi:hypothetical protein
MATTWSVALDGECCGFDGAPLTANDPVQLIGPSGRSRSSLLKRCVVHALGEVDWAQVDDAKFERERRAWATSSTPASAAPASSRLPAIRQPLPLSAIADTFFDPKAAAAGDRD